MATETGQGVIYVINKFKVKSKNQPFRCIMIYQDKDSGFCFIKPLLHKIDLEIVMELFRIFTSYGPPKEVHINSCSQEMVKNIDTKMKLLCPMFNIKFVKKNAGNNDIAMLVVTRLHKWMEITNREQWEIGCCIVQRQINTEVAADNKLTPQELYFKNLGKICANENDNSDDTDAPEIHEQNVTSNDALSEDELVTDPIILNFPDKVNTVQVKEEKVEEDINELSKDLSNYVIIYEGGVSFPHFGKQNTEKVQIKQEIIDD